MEADWPEARIVDVAEKVAMGPFGSSIKVETFVSSGVPVISGQHLQGSKVNDRIGFNFVSEEHADRLKNANVRRGDVIFTHAGSIGQVAFVPETSRFERYVISQRQFYMRCDRTKILPEFVVAYFKTAEGQHQLLANTSQVGVPSIAQPVTYLRTIEIPVPPIPVQRLIADVLGKLDDRIELNQQMNETLEAMARTLFKSWFIDFHPVRAKAVGRDPGVPKPIADLFPVRLEESELGDIPAGWTVGTLGDVAKHLRRSVQPSDIDAVTPYIALDHMPRRSIALAEWATAEGLESSKFEFKRDEFLFGKLRPYFHKVGVAPFDGVCSTDIVVLAPNKQMWFGFVLGHVSSSAFVDYTDARSTGTKMPRTKWGEMARYPIAVPPEAVAEAVTEQTKPIVDRIIAGIHEARSLATVRDTLLPKLMSGELRVPVPQSMLLAAPG